MSTDAPPPDAGQPEHHPAHAAAASAPSSVTPPSQQEIRIVSHSSLFYWWPVWAIGFLMGLLTLIDGNVMAVVPSKGDKEDQGKHSEVQVGFDATGNAKTKDPDRPTITLDGRAVLVFPKGTPKKNEDLEKPYLRISHSSRLGVIWATILLLVIVITNVPLRGLWSIIIIVLIALISVIFALAGFWDWILEKVSLLDIRVNAGGYFFISIILLGIWLVSNLVFDRQIYMIFTPGQLKVCLEIGGGETSYDTIGMVIQKQRDDLFRHWVLGLGSGDLIVRTAGANSHEFHLPNVLFVGRKLQLIEQMQRDRPVVT